MPRPMSARSGFEALARPAGVDRGREAMVRLGFMKAVLPLVDALIEHDGIEDAKALEGMLTQTADMARTLLRDAGFDDAAVNEHQWVQRIALQAAAELVATSVRSGRFAGRETIEMLAQSAAAALSGYAEAKPPFSHVADRIAWQTTVLEQVTRLQGTLAQQDFGRGRAAVGDAMHRACGISDALMDELVSLDADGQSRRMTRQALLAMTVTLFDREVRATLPREMARLRALPPADKAREVGAAGGPAGWKAALWERLWAATAEKASLTVGTTLSFMDQPQPSLTEVPDLDDSLEASPAP